MNPATPHSPAPLSDETLMAMLDYPERWPEDPAIQAQLADLLELHLALGAHRDKLVTSAPRRSFRQGWLLAAAAVLMAVVPGVFVVQQKSRIEQMAKDQARIDEVARQRTQERAWASFFQQASVLLQDFQHKPPSCERGEEDRRLERENALLLLSASHQLAAQGTPLKEAEQVRNQLHPWLSELALEDGCISSQRAQELRKYAKASGLEDQTERMSRLLKGDVP
jgi:hypothetical protein